MRQKFSAEVWPLRRVASSLGYAVEEAIVCENMEKRPSKEGLTEKCVELSRIPRNPRFYPRFYPRFRPGRAENETFGAKNHGR